METANKRFNIGDVVRLKSGGPLMTVTDCYTEYTKTHVLCTWFTEERKPQSYDFIEAMLTDDTDPAPPF